MLQNSLDLKLQIILLQDGTRSFKSSSYLKYINYSPKTTYKTASPTYFFLNFLYTKKQLLFLQN